MIRNSNIWLYRIILIILRFYREGITHFADTILWRIVWNIFQVLLMLGFNIPEQTKIVR